MLMDKKNNFTYESRSTKDTYRIGAEIAGYLKAGDIVILNGELGAGKTAFVQGAAKGLGVNGYVNSPTFTIMNRYEGRVNVYHFDTYRINDFDELLAVGAEEFIYGDGVSFVEWGEMICGELLVEPVVVDIKKSEEDICGRVISVQFPR